jgi:DNA-binding transcriptional ArsR family regulator
MGTKESAEAPAARQVWYPEREDITIYGVLAALSDPTRLGIVRSLAQYRERCPFEFLDVTSKQNLAHHFKVLREAGLIQSRYEGRNKFVWLRRDIIDEMFPGLLDGLLHAVDVSDPRPAATT